MSIMSRRSVVAGSLGLAAISFFEAPVPLIYGCIALVGTSVPKDRLGSALGFLQSGVIAGNFIRPLVGGLLAGLRGLAQLIFVASILGALVVGGFLALAALTNYGDRLIGGVDLAGIADFISFLTNTAPYRRSLRRAEYGDERDPEMRAYLRRISPLTNADRISKPLLVVHGKNDPRVPLSEAEQIVARLRSRGGDVWYLQAKDEGHGFRKKQNRDAYYRTFAQFILSLH